MEIERKWLVRGWPDLDDLPEKEEEMEQGYLVVRPSVRIRRESAVGGETDYVLCIKSGVGLARDEIEVLIPEEKYDEIRRVIGEPMIRKFRRTWKLPDGCRLEVNHVDEGLASAFWYAEIEFDSVEQALAWEPEQAGLEDYLIEEVTDVPGQSMGAYWERTRFGKL